MIDLYGNGFFDILTADAYYSNKPFVLFVDSLGKYLVSRVTNEVTTLYKEFTTLYKEFTTLYKEYRYSIPDGRNHTHR